MTTTDWITLLEPATVHALDNITWSFPDNASSNRAHNDLFDARKIHWYPATYIPEIPYSLIELLSKPGDKVLDPFSGIGTTIWQALALGREAYGAELTVVGQNASAAIWSLLARDADLVEVHRDVMQVLARGQDSESVAMFLDSERGNLLQPWFSPGTFRELALLAMAEESLTTPESRHLLRISISAILASVSEQRRGWGCIADNMKPREKEFAVAPYSRSAIEKVVQKVNAIVKLVGAARERISATSGFRAIKSDALTHLFGGDCMTSGALAREEFYDLIVTSPPYPAMVDYSTAQRLSYYWNGSSPESDTSKEIGARRRRFSARSLTDYTAEMTRVLHAMSRSVKPGGLIAMVIPVFSTTGEEDPRSIALSTVFDSYATSELELSWQTNRILPTGRRQLNQKWTSLKRENIRVYRRK